MGYVYMMDQLILTYRAHIFGPLIRVMLSKAYAFIAAKNPKIVYLQFLDVITIKYLRTYGTQSLKGKVISQRIRDITRYDYIDHLIVGEVL